MAETTHPEDALFNAGASNGYYEIVGASFTPADPVAGTATTATIDLSTMDQTGCLLTHDYSTAETTLKWDTEPFDPPMYGTFDAVQTAVEDITRGQMDHQALFDAFRTQMTSSEPLVDDNA